MILDDFPDYYLVEDDYANNVDVYRHAAWNGAVTPETEAARLQVLKAVGWATRRGGRPPASG